MVIQFTAFNQLCHDVEVNIVVKQFKDPHDMWMVCLLQNLKLLFHELDEDWMLADFLLVDNFDGASDTGLRVKALMNFAESATAKLSTYFILWRNFCRAFERFKHTELE